MEDFIKNIAEQKFQRRSSVSSLNRFISYKRGLTDGINMMKGWAVFYEENKHKLYIMNAISEEELLKQYLSTLKHSI